MQKIRIRRVVKWLITFVTLILISVLTYQLVRNSKTINPKSYPGLAIEVWGGSDWNFSDEIDDEKTADSYEKRAFFAVDVSMAKYLRERKYKASNQFTGDSGRSNETLRFVFRNNGDQTLKFNFRGWPIWRNATIKNVELAPGEKTEITFSNDGGMWYAWLSDSK